MVSNILAFQWTFLYVIFCVKPSSMCTYHLEVFCLAHFIIFVGSFKGWVGWCFANTVATHEMRIRHDKTHQPGRWDSTCALKPLDTRFVASGLAWQSANTQLRILVQPEPTICIQSIYVMVLFFWLKVCLSLVFTFCVSMKGSRRFSIAILLVINYR